MRKIQNPKFVFIFSLFTAHCLLFTAVVFAAEEGGHSVGLKDWVWPIINFAIIVFILIKFFARPMKEFFKKRTEMIERSIKEAEEAKQFAQKALAEVKERLRNSEREANDIIESARKAGEREKEVLIAEGERLKNKIIAQAKANVEFELKKAKETIKSEAALLALDLAERQIKERLGKKEHDALIEEYIKRLAKNTHGEVKN
jgi:F-type H+-transporting ATPase subunit b